MSLSGRILKSTALICLGIFLFIAGLSVKLFIFPTLFETAIYENLELVNGTVGYDTFVDPDVTFYMKYR